MSISADENLSLVLWRLRFVPFRHSVLFSDADWREMGRSLMRYARGKGWA